LICNLLQAICSLHLQALRLLLAHTPQYNSFVLNSLQAAFAPQVSSERLSLLSPL